MLKKILTFVVMFYAAICFAAVDANKGSAAELDGVKGIGPATSAKIIEERTKAPFKDWTDFIARVKGVGEGSAVKLSAAGLTVGGASYKDKPAASAPAAAKKDDKPAASAPAAAKKDDKPAAAAKDAKVDDKAKKSAPASAPASAASAAKK